MFWNNPSDNFLKTLVRKSTVNQISTAVGLGGGGGVGAVEEESQIKWTEVLVPFRGYTLVAVRGFFQNF